MCYYLYLKELIHNFISVEECLALFEKVVAHDVKTRGIDPVINGILVTSYYYVMLSNSNWLSTFAHLIYDLIFMQWSLNLKILMIKSIGNNRNKPISVF